jgi:hypothetical protein
VPLSWRLERNDAAVCSLSVPFRGGGLEAKPGVISSKAEKSYIKAQDPSLTLRVTTDRGGERE